MILVLASIVGYSRKEYFNIIASVGMIFLAPYIDLAMGTLYTRLAQEQRIEI
ncbi:hypothetical protein [Clostridium beijerinckii]|uniref:hypothetical protein n=1 Tax=Clostridium beijerinckii TaxID=1520 RepID=UPI001360FBF8|nr:hypothetical protein [Clostridium beijerinckii]MZK53117.1 hypothetical protein [Clostridium beijerinckii]MZK61245.1 hypothetical protein [Clostridium beijerinckii]MZK71444.1 hypothetical protein [Clostridium beijerinckii]MZK76784.1 hypothetical protein [Clostridium beijerinckii]MZK86511.1 hypothetical protein [Clostridium beijerinckii]